jgi:hypothetical protein
MTPLTLLPECDHDHRHPIALVTMTTLTLVPECDHDHPHPIA